MCPAELSLCNSLLAAGALRAVKVRQTRPDFTSSSFPSRRPARAGAECAPDDSQFRRLTAPAIAPIHAHSPPLADEDRVPFGLLPFDEPSFSAFTSSSCNWTATVDRISLAVRQLAELKANRIGLDAPGRTPDLPSQTFSPSWILHSPLPAKTGFCTFAEKRSPPSRYVN